MRTFIYMLIVSAMSVSTWGIVAAPVNATAEVKTQVALSEQIPVLPAPTVGNPVVSVSSPVSLCGSSTLPSIDIISVLQSGCATIVVSSPEPVVSKIAVVSHATNLELIVTAPNPAGPSLEHKHLATSNESLQVASFPGNAQLVLHESRSTVVKNSSYKAEAVARNVAVSYITETTPVLRC